MKKRNDVDLGEPGVSVLRAEQNILIANFDQVQVVIKFQMF